MLTFLHAPYAEGWDAFLSGMPYCINESDAWKDGWLDADRECAVMHWQGMWPAF